MATLGTTPEPRVRETSTDTGTGNFVLAGAKSNTEQAFLGAYGGGTSNVPYVIVNLDAAEWEEGLATVQDNGTGSSEIVRGGSQTVTASSNGGSAVSFSAGDKDVFSSLSGEQTAALFDHAVSTANPHGVTKSQVGLGNVPNEDATNPANWDQAGAITDQALVWNGTQWGPQDVTVPVDSVAGKTGSVTLNSADVNLGSVTNDAQLKQSSNLSDVNSISAARNNLGLGTQATKDQYISTTSQNTNNGDITYVV